MNLIVSMGIPAQDVHKRQEGFRYNGAVIQVIDWSRKRIVKEISYNSPQENKGNGLSLQFKGASIFNNKYYVVTNTEVLIYGLEDLTLEKVITLPSFNDLHGVLPSADCIYVCNTGLEIVIKFLSQSLDSILRIESHMRSSHYVWQFSKILYFFCGFGYYEIIGENIKTCTCYLFFF